VRDTGIGMDAAMLARLFEAFAQADRSLARSRGGLGLGLALVKALVELHGGEVRVASDGPGCGSEFTVRLPLEHNPVPPARPAAALPSAGRSFRILVIEDAADAAESMKILLELSGHQAAVAHTGPAAVATARRARPEVVLCDIGLPGGMDGYAVARALRQDPATATAYLIALTGYGREEDQRLAHDAGFDLHVIKPVDFKALKELLASLPPRP
jgi:CheY-like chemotaxis protein